MAEAGSGSDHFRRFLRDNGIDAGALDRAINAQDGKCPQRFVRVNTHIAGGSCKLEELRAWVGDDDVQPVAWLPQDFSFYMLPGTVNISSSPAYREGRLYGIDVSSGAAVAALGVRPGHAVLDVCCAPGAKLCLLADAMQRRGSLVGVDVSRERLDVCRRLLAKYKIEEPPSSAHLDDHWRCRVLCADGATFRMGPFDQACPEGSELVFDSESALAETKGRGSTKRVRMNKSARARESKRLRKLALGCAEDAGSGSARKSGTDHGAQCLFDRVLVDSQCTHDGSFRHVAKLLSPLPGAGGAASADVAEQRLRNSFEPAQLAKLECLQRALITNGFRLLQPGGSMVYATCSLAASQNEDIVSWFLEQESRARLVPTGFCPGPREGESVDAPPGARPAPCSPGTLPHTLRFTPDHGTSGLFIAKIDKVIDG